MAKFLIHLHQDGGCDYTIGCGDVVHTFEAFSKEGIEEEIKERVEDYGRDNIQKVTFYEITDNSAEIDIDGLFASDDAKYAADAKAKEEAKERKILDDLKKKYPDS
jgi:hypothetical protein